MPGPSCSRVATVVVTHHGPGPMLQACLRSLAGGDAVAPGQVVVVDNSGRPPADREPTADAPGSANEVAVEVLRVVNEGYGAAANAGARHLGVLGVPGSASTAGAPAADPPAYVALLNDDIVVEAGWLAPLIAALDADGDLGAVQPKLLLEPGVVNSVGVAIDRYGAGADLGYGAPDGADYSQPSAIRAFTGGAVLFRAAFLRDTAGFDERYFLYYEDVDLALRGAERGWRYRCVPASTVRHAQGSSSARLGDQLAYLRERNRLWTAFRFLDAATIARACWLGVRRVRHRPRRAHAEALAVGLAGAPRRLLERRRAGRAARARATGNLA
jgi:N-acetylglucosaminyl-diphospho-decaprenol L-rhamnosyltransferase